MDPKLVGLDAHVDFEEAEAEAWELDGLVGGLSPSPAGAALGSELDEDVFDANILAAYIASH